MNKIAATIIVKASDDSEAISLSRALGSINGYVDDIFIELNAPEGVVIDSTMRKIAEQFSKHVFVYKWDNNFVKARNFLMSKVPKKYDWLLWLDSDDIIDSPENIADVAAVMPLDVDGVHILYDYQKDKYGNTVVSHWPCRLVRNNGSYHWKSSFEDGEVAVHETLVPIRESRPAVSNNEFKVVHMANFNHYKDSLQRNIELLEGMAMRQAEKPEGIDPRILFYLGTHYNEAYRFKEAKELLYEYLKLSGWSEERSEAHVYMGKFLKMDNNLFGARTAFLMALGENPNNQSAYLELGRLEAKEQRWQQAVEWFERGVAIKTPITAMVRFNNDFELYTEYAQALANLGGPKLAKALKVATDALNLQPQNPDAVTNRDNLAKLVEHRDALRGVARILRTLKKDGEDSKVVPFLDALPESLVESPMIIEARQEYISPATWYKKSIAIYVGHGPLGTWGPWSLNEGGVGGSEEAVVRLSNELTLLGWKVTVFGTPGSKAGLHGGVLWKHYWEINNKDTFDVLISWRQPAFFDFNWKARKKYLWLHDVMPAEELTPERIKKVDKVIYVSQYHAERVESEHIPQKKKFASGNGINPDDFSKLDSKRIKRDLHRCIYMSANERGLRVLYDIWGDIRKAVPDATLDVYYGWESYDAVNRDNPERMAWKASMQRQAKELDGVTERGRIGQDELNQEIFKAGIFAYPCLFPEVSCITAMKAQAGGAWPVTSNFANLNNVVRFGTVLDMGDFTEEDIDDYKQVLIEALKHPIKEGERKRMMAITRNLYDWKTVASQWDKEMK